MLGEHGQILHVPFLQLFVIDVGIGQGDQVPEGPGDNIAVALHIALAASAAAQHPGKLFAHGGLFRQYKRLCHDMASLIVFIYYNGFGREINRGQGSGRRFLRVKAVIIVKTGSGAWHFPVIFAKEEKNQKFFQKTLDIHGCV